MRTRLKVRTARLKVRRAVILLVMLVTLGALFGGVAGASPATDGLCRMFLGPSCTGATAVAKGAEWLSDAAGGVFHGFTPQGVVEEWASSAARSSAELLAETQQNMILAGQPDFTSSWWLTRYAVTFGIGIVAMAIVITIVTGKLAGGGPEAVQLAKQTGLSAPLYVPLMAVAPAAVDIFVQMIYALSGWFGQQATADTGTAVEGYVRLLADMPDPNALAGGALFMLVVAGVTFLAALLAMIETTVAAFGAQLIMLLIPIAAAIGLYPPARQRLSQLAGILLGLLLTPVMLFLAWWLVWGATASLVTGESENNALRMMLFVAVASMVAVSAPAVLGLLGPAVGTSLTNAASHRLRTNTRDVQRETQSGSQQISRMSAARSSSAQASSAAMPGTGSGATESATAAGGKTAADTTNRTASAATTGSKVASTGPAAAATAGATAAQKGAEHVQHSAERAGQPQNADQDQNAEPAAATSGSGAAAAGRRADPPADLPVNDGPREASPSQQSAPQHTERSQPSEGQQ